MPAPQRQVRRLRLGAASEHAARALLPRLEDALRCASLPDTGAQWLLVRRLALGQVAAGASPQAIALRIERQLLAAGVHWVDGAADDAVAADHVRFASPLRAYEALGRRVQQGQPCRAWYWPRLVPGFAAQATARQNLRWIEAAVSSGPQGGVALAAWRAALAQGQPPPGPATWPPAPGLRLQCAVPTTETALAPHEPVSRLATAPAQAQVQAQVQTQVQPQVQAPAQAPGSKPVAFDSPAAAPAPTPLPMCPAADKAGSHDLSRHGRAKVAALPAVADTCAPGQAPPRCPPAQAPEDASARHAHHTAKDVQDPMAQARAQVAADAGAVSPPVLRHQPAPDAARAAARPAHASGQATDTAVPAPDNTDPLRPQHGPARATGASRSTPPASAHADGTPTPHAGLMFLLPVLARLGLPAWAVQHDAEAPAWAAAVLRSALLQLHAAPDDPCFDLLATALPQPARVAAWPRTWAQPALAPPRGRPAPTLAQAWAAAPDTLAQATLWLVASRRWLRRGPHIGLASLLRRPGRLWWSPTHVDVHLPLSGADLRVRRHGLDIDPGWLPWFGRVVAFHYGNTGDPS